MKNYRLRERVHEVLLYDLLAARAIAPDAHDKFLAPDYITDSHDPFLLPDMEKAVERILFAKKSSEKIAVWSDYDCDGIPGGVMLAEFLRTLGLSVRHYIPHRHKEGYGLNEEGIDELAEEGVTLIITLDLGTTEHAGIDHARTKSIDVIVTDHHLPSAPLPEAYALINPKRADSKYPFDGLCGAGVAWKLVQAILTKERGSYGEGQEKWLLDLVGIATLSDMVPLIGENRMLARFGLMVMRRGRRPGLAALLSVLRIKPHTLTEDDIGFMVAPRINAASRMDSPEIAARLLASEDPQEAGELARTLNRINDERKGVVASIVKEANKRLDGTDTTSLIVMGNPKWRPGVLGLVANTLVETYGKPVFLWGREGGDVIRGSVRSDGNLNVVELMSAAGDIFEHFGGHHASGGFSVREESVHELAQRLDAAYETLARNTMPQEVLIDRELQLAEMPHALRDIERLSPFGVGFEKPLFMFPRATIRDARMFGKTQNHLEVTLADGSFTTSGIAFFSTPASFQKKFSVGERADIVGHVEKDWRGSPRIRVVDII